MHYCAKNNPLPRFFILLQHKYKIILKYSVYVEYGYNIQTWSNFMQLLLAQDEMWPFTFV